jgi:hypothetical protein
VRTLELGPSFRAQVALAVAYDELATRLRAAAVGQTWGPPGRQLLIHGLDVRDAGGRVLVSLQVSGALQGTLHLWGTPTVVWEAAGGGAPPGPGGQPAGGLRLPRLMVTVPDLQAALETRSLLTRLQLGLLSLGGGGLGQRLREALRIDVTDRFREIQRAADQRLTRPAGAWSLTVSTSLLAEPPPLVISHPGELLVVATLGGEARLAPP